MANDLAVRDGIRPPEILATEADALVTLRMAGRSFNEKLLPIETAKRLGGALNEAMRPCSQTQAAALAAVMIGMYSRHNIAVPEIWADGIISVMCEYPAFLVKEAVDNLTRSKRFVPERSEVFAELERLSEPYRRAIASAAWMVDEHSRRAVEQAEEAEREAERQRTREVFKVRHGKYPEEFPPGEFVRLMRKQQEDDDGRVKTQDGDRHSVDAERSDGRKDGRRRADRGRR